MLRAKIWAARKIREAMVRHQRREAESILTRKSEPTPLRRRPLKEQTERMETCMAWRFMIKSSVAESS